MDAFEDLDPAAQEAAALAELDALSANLQHMLKRLRAIRVEVAEPDDSIRLTIGDDGRLLALFIADDVPRDLTNIELEHKINDLIRGGNEAVAEMHDDIIGATARI
jgi:hypothetical protein